MPANYRLKAARVLLGLTQLRLAEKVGAKEFDISRIETGRAVPSREMKQRIADALQKPAFEIFAS